MFSPAQQRLPQAPSTRFRKPLHRHSSGQTSAGQTSAQAPSPATATPAPPFRIDVHHHLTPPDYITAVHGKATIPPPSANWTVNKTLDDMDAAAVQTAILSISTPGLWFGDANAAAKLARGCNEYAAKLALENKGRFDRSRRCHCPTQMRRSARSATRSTR